jgi:hypothetical protein
MFVDIFSLMVEFYFVQNELYSSVNDLSVIISLKVWVYQDMLVDELTN